MLVVGVVGRGALLGPEGTQRSLLLVWCGWMFLSAGAAVVMVCWVVLVVVPVASNRFVCCWAFFGGCGGGWGRRWFGG